MASSVQSIVYLFSQPLVIRKTDENGNGIQEDVESVLDCSTERQIIQDIIKSSDCKTIRFRSMVATIPNVDKLFKTEATVVHLAAHGSDDMKLGIIFESDKGEAIVPTIDDLRKFLPVSGEPGRIKILFVSSCYSQSSGAALEETKAARHIIAVNRRISDTLSERFTKSFYQALFAGWTVQKAFNNAKMAIAIDDPQSSGNSGADSMFILLPRERSHEFCYFPRNGGTSSLSRSSFLDVHPTTRNHCVALLHENKFVGRYGPMQRIYSYLVDNNCVISVTGGPFLTLSNLCYDKRTVF